MKFCPCHSHKPYDECCGPFHQGKPAPTALALMRSRYSAYALKNLDYIIRTTHPDHSESRLPLTKRKKYIQKFCEDTQFEGLEILEFSENKVDATVTFKAILRQGEKDVSFTEKSYFLKRGRFWLYHSGKRIS